jgi:hypothetical protein
LVKSLQKSFFFCVKEYTNNKLGNIISQGKTDNPNNYQLGAFIIKDMVTTNTSGFIPLMSVVKYPDDVQPPDPAVVPTQNWADWGGDIFDHFGFMYIYDPAAPIGEKYTYIILDNINTADGELYTQDVTFNPGSTEYSREFTITYGYPVQGIFKLTVAPSDSNFGHFRVGMYGNMGSDGGTVFSPLTTQYIHNSDLMTLHYAVNMEGQSVTNNENLYMYMIPYDRSQQASPAYVAEYDGDFLSLYSTEVTLGINIYLAKEFDVANWVIYDLNGTLPGGE